MSTILHYRAGPRAMALIRREGLRPAIVRVLAGPASGPRWLVLTGIDRALIDGGFAAPPPAGQRRLLVGSSAGAWRMLAHAARDPHAAHDRLVSGYIRQ